MPTLTRLVLLAAVLITCVGCDQTTKHLAGRELKAQPPVHLLGGAVQLAYAENPGAFLSLGADLPEPLRSTLFEVVTAAIVLAVLGIALGGRSLGPGRVLCLGLVAAGGIGNLIDRIALGSARDFILLRLGPLHTGIFNVADIAITLGGLALLAISITRRAPEAQGP